MIKSYPDIIIGVNLKKSLDRILQAGVAACEPNSGRIPSISKQSSGKVAQV